MRTPRAYDEIEGPLGLLNAEAVIEQHNLEQAGLTNEWLIEVYADAGLERAPGQMRHERARLFAMSGLVAIESTDKEARYSNRHENKR